jgi:DNA-directed RNA polymerase subunit M/transcription elongation factor TFIIS
VADIETKVCTMCGELLTAYRNRGGSQTHLVKSRCNTCLYKEHKRWAEENPERIREYREKDSGRWQNVVQGVELHQNN